MSVISHKALQPASIYSGFSPVGRYPLLCGVRAAIVPCSLCGDEVGRRIGRDDRPARFPGRPWELEGDICYQCRDELIAERHAQLFAEPVRPAVMPFSVVSSRRLSPEELDRKALVRVSGLADPNLVVLTEGFTSQELVPHARAELNRRRFHRLVRRLPFGLSCRLPQVG